MERDGEVRCGRQMNTLEKIHTTSVHVSALSAAARDSFSGRMCVLIKFTSLAAQRLLILRNAAENLSSLRAKHTSSGKRWCSAQCAGSAGVGWGTHILLC
jgi:hypothetical protein